MNVEMDKMLSNKERFDKLKDSRQKYKEEALRQREEASKANQKADLLEKQLQMLVRQMEASSSETNSHDELDVGPSAHDKNDSDDAERVDALRIQIGVLTTEVERQKKLARQATETMRKKTAEADEWRKSCEAAERRIANAAVESSATSQYAGYVYGALLGASAVAIIGYGALSISMRTAR